MSTTDSRSDRTRTLAGVVVSDASDKTVVVAVTTVKSHPVYKKRYKVTKKYAAHDEKNLYKVGDSVQIKESRPVSRTKRWVVVTSQ